MPGRVAIGIFVAVALVSAVPAEPAFFPFRAVKSLADDDLTGSGSETTENKTLLRAASREESDLRQSIRRWREIAISARRDARFESEAKRVRLLELAEWCEARANRLEESISST